IGASDFFEPSGCLRRAARLAKHQMTEHRHSCRPDVRLRRYAWSDVPVAPNVAPVLSATIARVAPFLTLLLLAAASSVSASCITDRCSVEHQPAVEALRAEIEAACNCPGSADHRTYARCAKALVRTAQQNGRVSRACGLAVTAC